MLVLGSSPRLGLQMNKLFSFFFLLFFLFPFFYYLDLPLAFISSYNLSGSYTWRAEIALLKLWSPPEHTSKLYLIILAVPPLFIVISSLMRPEKWLPCINAESMASIPFFLHLSRIPCQVCFLSFLMF